MRISDWSSDVCSSDLHRHLAVIARILDQHPAVIGQRRQQDIALPRMWPVLVARQPDLLGPAAKVGIARAAIGDAVTDRDGIPLARLRRGAQDRTSVVEEKGC